MAIATRKEVHDAIVTTIQGVSGVGKCYARIRRPPQNTSGQVVDLFAALGVVNVIFARYVGLTRDVAGFNPPSTVTKNYIFEIEIRYVWNETDDDDTASETIFNALVDNIDAAFTDTQLGFDPGVSINGVQILQGIPRDTEFYGMGCHTAIMQLVVNVSEC